MKGKRIKEIFSENGILSRSLPGFEYRPQQQALAESVWSCLDSGEGDILLAEAPTGIGKTHALLVPSIYWSLENEKKVLFLTSGIPLQEQIALRDLPELCRCLGVEGLPFGLIKGKGNYLCRLRGKEIGERELLSLMEPDIAGDLFVWMESTVTGDFSEIAIPPSHPVISAVAAGTDMCRGSACPFRDSCFLKKVLQQAQEWKIIVGNYHLFFSYSAATGRGFPVPFDAVICDEAHRLTEAARMAAAIRSSADDWSRMMDYGRTRVIPRLEWLPENERDDGAAASDRVRREAERLFASWKREIRQGEVFSDENTPPGDPEELLERTQEMLRIVGLPPESGEKDTQLKETSATLLQWRDGVSEIVRSLQWCAKVGRFPEWAYWWDGKALLSAPTECCGFIRNWLFPRPLDALVAVSATIAIGDDFSFWERETGLHSTESMVLDSPFRLGEQMSVWVVDMGLAVTDEGYDSQAGAVVEKLCDENGGRTLVLLSSIRLMKAVAVKLRSAARPYAVLVQGDLPRNELLRRFREDISSVLVGSVSFREGIDVPGEGLTQVIIDRIPFPYPGDPLLVTRRALEGKAIFKEVILPWAKLLLKQAAGRLIRTGSDRGKVVILDGRVLSRGDWRITDALPKVPYKKLEVREERNKEADVRKQEGEDRR
ncbi:MAG: ATP-dependent DNA helicase [Thermovirgaceae bacterium]|nr:ATP-dependent DNA helicase [Thermovirgaceae bacterium]